MLKKEGFPGGLAVKMPPANAGDAGSIPRWGKIPRRRKRLPAPVFILAWRNPADGGAWRATVHRVAKSQTRPSDGTAGNALKGMLTRSLEGFPGGSAVKNLPASARRHGFIPGPERLHELR